MIMKRILILIAALTAFATLSIADDRPAKFSQIPPAAQSFIRTNYP